MRRREFITLLGGAVAWPVAARAQQPALPLIGFLPGVAADKAPFRVGLKATGFVEGQNVAIRWAEGRNDKLPELSADFVRRQVAVIVAPTTPSVLAAKAATKTIPIVFFTAGDPIDLGLVTSLKRPDSNLTGATTLTLEVGQKWVQLLHEMVPKATSLALLINPTSPNLAKPNRATYKLRLTVLGCNFMCWKPAPIETSTAPSQALLDCGRVGS
jgi:putative ABC transport system substrate-binding protein